MKGLIVAMAVISGIISVVSIICSTFMFMNGMVLQPITLLLLSYFFRYRIEWQGKN